jgi:hypothetical protein
MYFFILETTTRISFSTPSVRVSPGTAAGAGETSAMMRRRCASPAGSDEDAAEGEGEGDDEGSVVEVNDCGGVPRGDGEAAKPVAVAAVTADGEAAGRTIGPGAGPGAGAGRGVEDENVDEDEDDVDDDVVDDDAGRAGGADSCASSDSQAWRLGLRASTAQASRWRASATWLSQQDTEQNTRRVRLRLQVETLHTQWIVEKPSSLRQALHLSQKSLMA